MNSFRPTLILVAATIALLSGAAQAQSIRLKCETRGDRSVASIDGNNLASGDYTAALQSGTNSVTAPARHTVGDEVGFDFSSQPRDIRHGATPIGVNFIVGGRATGQLLDSQGQTVASASARCKVR